MGRILRHSRPGFVVTIAIMSLASCSGSKVLPEPQVLIIQDPLATASDERMEIILDWVTVPDGLGSWATSANWDEFQLRVRNLTDKVIRISGIAVYDSLNTRIESTANREKLDAGSKQSAGRYRSDGVNVNASTAGQNLVNAGATMVATGMGAAVATGYGGITAAGASAATGALILAPVLIVVGAVQSMNDDRVAQELVERHTVLPIDLLPGEQRRLVAFFPLAPSPLQLELDYRYANADYKAAVDTREILQGMHVDNRTAR
jgi:hypothetical protein